MFPVTPPELTVIFGAVAFALGVMGILLGFYMLLSRSFGKEMKVLATQSAKLGQKALTDNISTLASSTTQLVDAVNSLVRTSTGIGVFFVVVGMVLMASAYYAITYIGW